MERNPLVLLQSLYTVELTWRYWDISTKHVMLESASLFDFKSSYVKALGVRWRSHDATYLSEMMLDENLDISRIGSKRIEG